jgi:hypothetical protein
MDAFARKYQKLLAEVANKNSTRTLEGFIKKLTSEEPENERMRALFALARDGNIRGAEMLLFLGEAAGEPVEPKVEEAWKHPDPYENPLGKLETYLSQMENQTWYKAYNDTVHHFVMPTDLVTRRLLMETLVAVAKKYELISAEGAEFVIKELNRKGIKKKKQETATTLALALQAPELPTAIATMVTNATALVARPAPPRQGPARGPAPSEPPSQSGGILVTTAARSRQGPAGRPAPVPMKAPTDPPRSKADDVVENIIEAELKRRLNSTRELLKAYANLWRQIRDVQDVTTAVSMKKTMRLLGERIREHLPYLMDSEEEITDGLGEDVDREFGILRAADQPADDYGDYPILGEHLPYVPIVRWVLEQAVQIAHRYIGNGYSPDDGATLGKIYAHDLHGNPDDIAEADPFSGRLPIYICMMLDVPFPAQIWDED